jgi:YVTN family beta-propeller protein
MTPQSKSRKLLTKYFSAVVDALLKLPPAAFVLDSELVVPVEVELSFDHQTVNVGTNPRYPVFDGTNIWVPNNGDNSVSVVRAATGAVTATLTNNGLNDPRQAAFDGQRILVTNNGWQQRVAVEGGGSDPDWHPLYWSWHQPIRGVQRRH